MLRQLNRIRQKIARRVAPVAILASAAAVSAGGAQFGLNLDVNNALIPSVPSDAYGAAAFQAGRWNSIYGPSTAPQNLVGLDGAPSGVTLYRQHNGIASASCVGGISTINWRDLMCDYQFDAAGVVNNIVYTFEGLPAGIYDVYTYACRPGIDTNSSFAIELLIDGNSVGFTFVGGPVLVQQFSEGLTHDLRTVSVPGGADLTIRLFDTSGEFGDPIACNGIQLVRTGDPNAVISSPTPISCVCGIVDIIGSANVPAGNFGQWWLEFSATGADPWTLIDSGSSPVTNGVLGNWDTTGLAEGYYFVRLTATNGLGQTSTAVSNYYVNQDFSIFDISGPANNAVVAGIACVGGTIWDQCFEQYRVLVRPAGGGTFLPVDPAFPFYASTKTNETVATWDTIGLGVPDGDYEIRVEAYDDCGNQVTETRFVTVDNTAPVTEITSPRPCAAYCGDIVIRGTVSDAHLKSWALQFTGGGQNGWTTIATGTDDVVSDIIAVWDTTGLEGCCYTLRLVASDQAVRNCNGVLSNNAEHLTTVEVGAPWDIDGSGVIDVNDLNLLLEYWGERACP